MDEKSPGERRHTKIRQEILDAARTIINEQGVDGLSMRTLAERVNYSPAALYNYFDSKEEIVEAIRAEGWALSAAMQEDLPRDLPLPELLYRQGLAYLKFAEAYPDYYLLMMSPSDNVPANMATFIGSPNFRELVDFVEAAVASGGIALPPGYTPLHVAFLMWFLVHGISMLKLTLMRDCQPEFDEISAQVLRGLVEAFVGG
ncbi:MAG: TetR/AcrR family transcriptional regulator [Anaerolineae bacterium]|nr:TetR/AcrR family transcriptional regulator [Anaerolineae bacterium]